uniref:Uncharacterized protein n=1 Tax=Megaselia scalaris TaxID=36166 RepID=T1GY05_MEGSC
MFHSALKKESTKILYKELVTSKAFGLERQEVRGSCGRERFALSAHVQRDTRTKKEAFQIVKLARPSLK